MFFMKKYISGDKCEGVIIENQLLSKSWRRKYGNRLFVYNVILSPEHNFLKSAMDDELGVIKDT